MPESDLSENACDYILNAFVRAVAGVVDASVIVRPDFHGGASLHLMIDSGHGQRGYYDHVEMIFGKEQVKSVTDALSMNPDRRSDADLAVPCWAGFRRAVQGA